MLKNWVFWSLVVRARPLLVDGSQGSCREAMCNISCISYTLDYLPQYILQRTQIILLYCKYTTLHVHYIGNAKYKTLNFTLFQLYHSHKKKFIPLCNKFKYKYCSFFAWTALHTASFFRNCLNKWSSADKSLNFSLA